MIEQISIKSHKDLLVWQRSMKLVKEIYLLTEDFPSREVYGLSSQMRRCAVSIPSNIAEGKSRHTRRDYKHFIVIACGSAAELETQLELALELGFANKDKTIFLLKELDEVRRMLTSLVIKLAE